MTLPYSGMKASFYLEVNSFVDDKTLTLFANPFAVTEHLHW